jgi:phage-related protein
VDVRYDPFDISIIEIWHAGKFQRKAEKLHIQEFVPKQESVPAVTLNKPTHSRLLKVYEEKNKEREKQRNSALSFHNPQEVNDE